MSDPTRPILRWHGGKWAQARKILRFFPRHRVYTEVYGGAWSVGMQKPRSYAEIWNDIDDELVNLFQVLRDERMSRRLIASLELTPFARTEFEDCYRPTRNRVERARRLVVRSFMGHGSDGASGIYRTGFRAASNRSGTTPAHDWANFAPAVPALVERLQGVVIERRPALQVLERHDSIDTLHFVDPPYLHSTRTRANRRPDSGGVYRHEMDDAQHAELLGVLRELDGMVVLCGYPSELYDELLPDWRQIEREAVADGALPRIEVLYLNPACVAALGHGPLFEVAA